MHLQTSPYPSLFGAWKLIFPAALAHTPYITIDSAKGAAVTKGWSHVSSSKVQQSARAGYLSGSGICEQLAGLFSTSKLGPTDQTPGPPTAIARSSQPRIVSMKRTSFHPAPSANKTTLPPSCTDPDGPRRSAGDEKIRK